MNQQTDPEQKPESPPQDPPQASEPYEPPKITKVGSLRDVVGKSGPNIDFSTHNRARP